MVTSLGPPKRSINLKTSVTLGLLYIKHETLMDNFSVTLSPNHKCHFQVEQHPHHVTGGCKYKIYQDGKFVASLEPDSRNFLHVCQNPAAIELEILHMLAEQIELVHPGTAHLEELQNIELDSDDELEAPPQ